MPEVERTIHPQPLPIADPSVLTTKQLLREVEILYNVIDDKVDARQREALNMKELLENEIDALRIIMKEQLESIKTQFQLIEKQRVEQKKDTKDAVDAALIAQKEAVKEQTVASERAIAKSEAATAKQLDQLAVTFSTAITGVTASVNDLKDTWNSSIMDIKDRIGRMENMRIGAQEQKKEVQSNMGMVYGMGGFVLVLITIFATLAGSGIFSK